MNTNILIVDLNRMDFSASLIVIDVEYAAGNEAKLCITSLHPVPVAFDAFVSTPPRML